MYLFAPFSFLLLIRHTTKYTVAKIQKATSPTIYNIYCVTSLAPIGKIYSILYRGINTKNPIRGITVTQRIFTRFFNFIRLLRTIPYITATNIAITGANIFPITIIFTGNGCPASYNLDNLPHTVPIMRTSSNRYNITVHTIHLFLRMSVSFFFDVVSISTIGIFLINQMFQIPIILKQRIKNSVVSPIVSGKSIQLILYGLPKADNNIAVINCDNNPPSIIPITNENMPIHKVSAKNIPAVVLRSIPIIVCNANSRCLRCIINRFT